ncbi:MAG: hypothetical protein HY296_04140 [Thaumarchaeota archaeon]|nr:hypothetical protein [Nitrososphaerota archaeon]
MADPETLLIAAALVGAIHISAPDHWVTLCVVGRTSGWGTGRLLYVGVATAAGHSILSVALGLLVVGAGLLFAGSAATLIAEATGVVMIVAGVGYGLWQFAPRKRREVKSEGAEAQARTQKGFRFRHFALIGAALSPDLTILPILLVAMPEGFGLALDAALVFGVVSVVTLPVLLLIGSKGLARAFERIPPTYNDALLGFVVAAVGAYTLVTG